jgi:parallel beta-helix repeat protein
MRQAKTCCYSILGSFTRIFALGLATLCAGLAPAAVLDVGPGKPYTTIGAALTAAQPGDTVRIAAGTYSAATGETFPLRIDKAITVDAAVTAWPPTVTVQGDGSNTVVLVSKPGSLLRGLTITGGMGSEGPYAMDGGGICVYVGAHDEGRVTIDTCLVESNACPSDATYDGCGGGIYAGGTYCTCFNTFVTNSTIHANTVHGNGGGIYGAIISRVRLVDSIVEDNSADDRGGGVCADLFADLIISGGAVRSNVAAGDRRNSPAQPDWGGKGGGIYVAGLATADIRDCGVLANAAKYFGGGLFVESRETNNVMAGCTVASNRADAAFAPLANWQPSGGGAYLREGAFLRCADMVFYHNDAQKDGGGILVAGSGSTGGHVILEQGCLLEGNECTRDGGGLALGSGAQATVSATRLLGNTGGNDGGAIHAAANARIAMDDTLVTYNNAARGYGAGLYLAAGSVTALERVTLAGNFAAWGRSAIARVGGACSITNSILWRNAGGSVTTNAPGLSVGYSLVEDTDVTGTNISNGSPLYVGWGGKTALHVDAAAAPGGDGTAGTPYQDLQTALDAFDFALGAGSPCLNTASDGGNIGAATGTGGTPGNDTVELRLVAGTYHIRGRNIAMTRGVVGNGSAASTIRHTVFGHIEDTYFRDLAIAGDAWYGGAVTRNNALFDRCRVTDNTSLYDGGGIFVAGGTCTLSNSVVDANTSRNCGGGLWIGRGCHLVADASEVCENRSQSHGGGVFVAPDASALVRNASRIGANANNFNGLDPSAEGGGLYAVDALSVTVDDSTIDLNSSSSYGGGLRVHCPTVVWNSVVATNSATEDGGGIYTTLALQVTNSTVLANTAIGGDQFGGGIHANDGTLHVTASSFERNHAQTRGGGLVVQWGVDAYVIERSSFVANDAAYGGAAWLHNFNAVTQCVWHCRFERNTAQRFGAVDVDYTKAHLFDCHFSMNTAVLDAGAMHLLWGMPFVDACTFASNACFRADHQGGGALLLYGTQATVSRCTFEDSFSASVGGMASVRHSGTPRFLSCTNFTSQANEGGGGVYVADAASPVFHDCLFDANRSEDRGGAVALRDTAAARFYDTDFVECSSLSDGGAFSAEGQSTALFDRCRFEGNQARNPNESADGGAMFMTEASRTTLQCVRLIGNDASDDGGAASLHGSASLTATNVLIAGNTCLNNGGGLHFVSTSQGTLQNCTVASNAVANGTAGGLYIEDTAGVTANSCILHANTPLEHDGSGSLTLDYTCITGGFQGTGNLDADPQFVWPGATLAPGSPCIDAGDPNPALDDAALPPGQGTVRNDMGWTGGPGNGCTGLKPQTALLKSPLALCAAPGQESEPIAGEITISPLTGGVGPVPTLEVDLGRGDAASHPSNWTLWTSGVYGGANGASDIYTATIPAPDAGTDAYAWRFRLNGGPWFYADAGGIATSSGPLPAAGEFRAGDIVYADFAAAGDLALLDACLVTNDLLRVTPDDIPSARGGAWYRFRVPVDDADGFDTTFAFCLHDPDKAYGFACVLHDDNQGTNAIGGTGVNLGYSGLVRSLAIEFDTWKNGSDPDASHVSVQTKGSLGNSSDHAYSLGSASVFPSLADGRERLVRISYAASRMRVYVDDLRTPIVDALLDQPLAEKLGLTSGWVWVGFTATTGVAIRQNHDIHNWIFSHSPVTAFPDADGDGLPDWWELLHCGSRTGANTNAHSDTDGVCDGDEFAADTDPNDPDCYLRLTDLRPTDTGIDIHWRGGQGVPQVLEARDSLTDPEADWTPIHTVPTPTPVFGAYPHNAPVSTQRFYRIRIGP